MGAVVVLTTAASREEADRISQALVERRLAACVQVVGPIESRYRWEDRVEVASEWLCLVKTTSESYDAVETAISEVHSYDTPEILALPVVAGSSTYLSWLTRESNPG